MLKIDKTGVSTSKRVYFRMFMPSLASVMAVRPCFCSFLLFVVEVPANFVETAKRAITCISEHIKVAKSVDIAVPELAVTIPHLLGPGECCGTNSISLLATFIVWESTCTSKTSTYCSYTF